MRGTKHYIERGAIYFITSVTALRKPLFYDRRACQFLMVCLEYQKYILDYRIYGFVIMPDHLHCLVQPCAAHGISKIMNHIKGNFARKFNLVRKQEGAFWQEGYYDRGVRGVRQFMNELNYMHQNPVRAGLVALPQDYEFSSYHYYYGNQYRNLIDKFAGGP